MKISHKAVLTCLMALPLLGQTACAGITFSGHKTPVSFIYTDAGTNEQTVAAKTGTKTGQACATSILGLVTTGDATVAAAAKAGGIAEVAFVDHHIKDILGIFAEYCVIVSGE